MLFITPDFLIQNIHYSFSFRPCYYSLFSFHPQTSDIIWYNQLLSDWLPINYLLITRWFHWCHRLVLSRVSSGNRGLLCGRPARLTGLVSHVRLRNMSPIYTKVSLCSHAFPCFPYVIPCFSMFSLDSTYYGVLREILTVNRHGLGGRIGLLWTGINIDLICWHFASKTRRKGGSWVKKCGPNIFWFLLSCFLSFSLFVLQVIAFPPHVLLIILVDLGWSDVGFHRGGPVRAFPAMCEADIGEQPWS